MKLLEVVWEVVRRLAWAIIVLAIGILIGLCLEALIMEVVIK